MLRVNNFFKIIHDRIFLLKKIVFENKQISLNFGNLATAGKLTDAVGKSFFCRRINDGE